MIPIVEERAHALLSASGSKIWLNCTRSARFSEHVPDEETDYSREGTWAHSVAAHRLGEYLGEKTEYVKEKLIPGFEEFANADSSEAIHAYVRRCIAQIEDARKNTPDTLVLLEQRLNYSRWVPEGFGTGDLVIVADRLLRVRDLKFGKGVLVDAEDNTQLMLYALGAVAEFKGIYDFDKILVEIDQPRRNHVDGWDEPMLVADLLKWAEEYVRPRALLAFAGEGEFTPGEHCRWCKGRHECTARKDYLADMVDQEFEGEPIETVKPERLTPEQIAAYLPRLGALKKWASDLEEHALSQALSGAKKWPGLKLVTGRSTRKITDPDGLATILEAEGYARPLLFETPEPPAMLGLGALEKVVGAKKFKELSVGFVDKAEGKPTLVSAEDPRPEFIPKNADDDFEAE